MTPIQPPTGRPPLYAPEPVSHLLRDLVHERTGVYFDDERLNLLLEKLENRARHHECATYLEYYYILKYEEKGPDEWRRVMDAFSVQETYFWREIDQVRALVDIIVPAWFKTRSAPFRIWSAACASGEEPYTIAIALEEAGWGGYPIEIVASDGSESALERARQGIYRERSFRTLSEDLKEKYFEPCEGGHRLIPSIKDRVRFQRANLVEEREIDDFARSYVIFCRNVFIYFSPKAITRVVETFSDRMPAGGYLFVGTSESLVKLTTRFELQELGGAFVYAHTSSAR